MKGVVNMSRSKNKSLGFDTIIAGVVEGLGKAVIGEVFSRSGTHNSNVHKDVNVIDMKKDDEGCWRIIENE
jgi:hypothetical protein